MTDENVEEVFFLDYRDSLSRDTPLHIILYAVVLSFILSYVIWVFAEPIIITLEGVFIYGYFDPQGAIEATFANYTDPEYYYQLLYIALRDIIVGTLIVALLRGQALPLIVMVDTVILTIMMMVTGSVMYIIEADVALFGIIDVLSLIVEDSLMRIQSIYLYIGILISYFSLYICLLSATKPKKGEQVL